MSSKSNLGAINELVDLLREQAGKGDIDADKLAEITRDPLGWAEARVGFPFSQWQREYITGLMTKEHRRIAVVSPRQAGKSVSTAAAVALYSLLAPGKLSVVVSPTSRQSNLLHGKVRDLVEGFLVQSSQTSIELSNGSRVLSLPGDRPSGLRGIACSGIAVVDESSFARSSLILDVVTPMVAGQGDQGCLCLISTPNGNAGPFADIFNDRADDSWHRVRVSLADCSHYDEAELEEQRARLGPVRFSQEFEGQFLAPQNSAFGADLDDLFGAFTPSPTQRDEVGDPDAPLSGFLQ